MTPAGFNHSEKLARLDFALLGRIHDKPVRSQQNLIINLTTKKQISTGCIHMNSGLQPFAFEHGLTTTGHGRHNVTRSYRFLGGIGRHELSLDLWLHFLDECFSTFGVSVHNEHALQIANSIDSDKLALRLPSRTEQSGLPGIRPRKNSSSQTARSTCAFLSERVGFDDSEQIRCLCGVEKEEKLRFTSGDGVCLVSEVAGNR